MNWNRQLDELRDELMAVERRCGEGIAGVRARLAELRDPEDSTVIPIVRPEPTATLEFTEAALEELREILAKEDFVQRPHAFAAYGQMGQALAIESAPGGLFHDGGGAA